MEIDPNVLLALMAVRILGGHAVPAGAEAVKALKKPIKEAVEKGWLKEEKVTETPPAEPGKEAKPKKVPVVALTEEGERMLQQAGSTEVLAMAQANYLRVLSQRLEADLQGLKAEVLAVLPRKKEKDEDKMAKELAKLAQLAADLTARVEKLTSGAAQEGPEPILARIDQVFEGLRGRVDRALQGLPVPAAAPAPVAEKPAPFPPEPTPPPAPPSVAQVPPPPPAPPEPETLAAVLRKAYETLCRTKFPEGMVELPSLFHEAQRTRSDLTLAEFHREIEGLEGKRALDLHIRPDTHNVPEADKGIHRNNKLYYSVYWSPRP